MITDAKREANRRHLKSLDHVTIRFQKGRKAEMQAHAQERGESLNSFINRAITEAMQRDNA